MIINVNNQEYEVSKHPEFTRYATSKCGKVFALKIIKKGHNVRISQYSISDEWYEVSQFIVKAKHTPRYKKCRVTLNSKTKIVSVHRFILECWVGIKPKTIITRHLNGISTDNRLENLCYGTVQENVDDSFKHDGNYAQGERNGRARLNENDVITIRQRFSNGETAKEIHADYPFVTDVSVNNVCRGITWKHI